MIFDKETIKGHLPHREPFLFVDGVEKFDSRSIVATFTLTPDMPIFKGHFPNRAIVPGVVMQEALAQASGLVLALSGISDGGIFYFASANMKFVSVVEPAAKILLYSTLVKSFNGLYQFEVEAAVSGGRTAAKGTIVLASDKSGK